MKLKNVFKSLLFLIPMVMIGWQFYASHFENLSKWKGSGYAMYTNSHPKHRSIVFQPLEKDTMIQVFPIDKDRVHLLSKEDKSMYYKSFKTMENAAIYPEYYEKELFKTEWVNRFHKLNGKLHLYRVDLDLDLKEVRSVKMYTYE